MDSISARHSAPLVPTAVPSLSSPSLVDMNRYRTVLEGSLQLAREGNTEAAIHALESILDGPIADDSLDWISLLARNAGVICEQRSEIDRALGFYERGLQFVPDDLMLLLAAGNICGTRGKS
jgi:hypothetical protein